MNAPEARRQSSDDAVAVIGGGLSGLAAARELAEAGAEVAVFDKGRRVGGRLSTREAGGGRRFDHGAQYFTAKSPRFERQVARWRAEGVVGEWRGRIASFTCRGERWEEDETPGPKTRCVGVPGMNAPALRLAEQAAEAGASITTGVSVGSLERAGNRWRLLGREGEPLGDFARVLVTAPAPQAADLLSASPALASAARSVRVAPCWAAMIALERRLEVGFDGAFVNGARDATPLSWVARDGSKPSRPDAEDAGDCWVLHGSSAWSLANLEAEPESVLAALVAGFAKVVGAEVPPAGFSRAHRWRHALPENPPADRCLADPSQGLYAAGDWCGGPRVEGAFLSGLAAAEALLS